MLFGKTAVTTLAAVAVLASGTVAIACPFCTAVSQTFSEEMAGSSVVVIAELVEPASPPSPGSLPGVETIKESRFRIDVIIKGSDYVERCQFVDVFYFGGGKIGDRFYITGVDPPDLMWSTTPLPVDARQEAYLRHLDQLPPEGAGRLLFFEEYLEDADEMLARDAYDEFALAPYSVIQDLSPDMDHDQLIQWISDTNTPPSRRRLYLTMLGVCGSSNDLPLLESMMQSEDTAMKAGLDAMIACYLALGGKERLPLIDELFITNKDAEFADTYAAIMALRFHGTEGGFIEQDQILLVLRHLLDRPVLADLVIPDLARWGDWSVMPKLVQLFKDADETNSWVRVPVVNYLRACPLPEAEEYLAQLEEIDPEAIRRANTFFPFGKTIIPGREIAPEDAAEASSSRIPAS